MIKKFSDLACAKSIFSDQALRLLTANPFETIRRNSEGDRNVLVTVNKRFYVLPNTNMKDLYCKGFFGKLVDTNKGQITYENIMTVGLYMTFKHSTSINWNKYDNPIYNSYYKNLTITQLIEKEINYV